MTANDFVSQFSSLSCAQQLTLLAQLAAELTVCARDTYEVGTNGVTDPERLRRFNEFQHQVTQHLAHLVDERRQRYPDDVIASTLAEFARELDCEGVLVAALKRSLDKVALPAAGV